MVNKYCLLLVSFISLLICSDNFIASGQNSTKDMFLEAESYFLFEEYNEALPLYSKLLRENPYNNNLNYRIGICYLYHDYKKKNAIKYLEKAANNISPNYKEGSVKETKAPVDALFYLGDAYRVNDKPDLAIKYFRKFLSLVDDDEYDTDYVKKMIQSCENSKILEKRPVDLISTNLGDPINSRFAEFNAVISGDGKTLAFTRSLQFYDGIFVSYRINNTWTNPQNIITQLGVDGDVLTSSLNKTGTVLYLYRGDEYDGNIYASRKNGNTWSNIEKLNKNINTKYWESNASVSNDGNTLYFASNRKGGFGGLDIYESKKDDKGDWGPAKNLGDYINTEYNEDAPFISENGKILFFTSDGHVNMGGYDIFYSEKNNDSWTAPENFGYPINTPRDELFFVPFNNGKNALVSQFTEDTRGLKDIVKLEIFWKLNPKLSDGIATEEINPELKKVGQTNTTDITDDGAKYETDNKEINEMPVIQELQQINQQEKEVVNKKASLGKTERAMLQKGNPDSTEEEFDEIIQDTEANLNKNFPVLNIPTEEIDVTSDEEIYINLLLEKNATLLIETFNHGKLIETQTYAVRNENFLLKFIPVAGENVIKLQITDKQNKVNQKEIVINYLTDPQKNQLTQKSNSGNIQLVDLNILFDDIYKQANPEQRKSLDEYKNSNQTITSFQLIKHLFTSSSQYGYDQADIINLILSASKLNRTTIEEFFKKTMSASGIELKDFLSALTLNEQDINTPADLLNFILKKESIERYTKDDIYTMLEHLLINSFDNMDIDSSLNAGEKLKKEEKLKENHSTLIVIITGIAFLLILILFFVRKNKA